MREKVIVDCDPGIDDAWALAVALAHTEAIDVLGVTSVQGNVAASVGAKNAMRIVDWLSNGSIPVLEGCSRPLIFRPAAFWDGHGVDGLGDVSIPDPVGNVKDTHGVDFIIDEIMSDPGCVSIAAIGPLTNVAIALVKEPKLISACKGIRIMGGALTCAGNSSPFAEFNWHADPFAANIVMSSGAPIFLFELGLTRRVAPSEQQLTRWLASQDEVTRKLAFMLQRYGDADRSIHDLCVIASFLSQSIFQYQEQHVQVEIFDKARLGQAMSFASPGVLTAAKCKVAIDLRIEELWEVVECAFTRLIDVASHPLK